MDSSSTGIHDMMMIMVMMTMIVMMIMSLMMMMMMTMLTVKMMKEMMMMMMFDELIALCINRCLQSSQSTNLPTVPCHDIRFDMHS